ncbi:hypothetical protein FFLO_06401 [Filobasidium floriforme]|uniref:Uncharacterized protein n=1 Tax=Filobasidium floriforme TaxID=5210 RepID=A0A8K0JFG3_9TREE|nr:uncharacterized protein HD553DRAFT_325019 [Filobasidium floriforme]KAG7528109.1 hypothetical protein FFLO_06401 [Filobasidium floriforme]KAH8082782.1 hypothetical protein HD553DRAFT_325019 [Filobasidium floriforme]
MDWWLTDPSFSGEVGAFPATASSSLAFHYSQPTAFPVGSGNLHRGELPVTETCETELYNWIPLDLSHWVTETSLGIPIDGSLASTLNSAPEPHQSHQTVQGASHLMIPRESDKPTTSVKLSKLGLEIPAGISDDILVRLKRLDGGLDGRSVRRIKEVLLLCDFWEEKLEFLERLGRVWYGLLQSPKNRDSNGECIWRSGFSWGGNAWWVHRCTHCRRVANVQKKIGRQLCLTCNKRRKDRAKQETMSLLRANTASHKPREPFDS